MNKVIIAGSRSLNNYSLVVEAIKESGFEIDEVVSGQAVGIDTCGALWAVNNNISLKSFYPDWKGLGKSAGYVRNKEMAKYGTHLILIWDGKSKGSGHMLNLAKEYKLKIYEKIVE